jgi:hypothetical protein
MNLSELSEVFTGPAYSFLQVSGNLSVALVLGLLIALVYRRTHHGISYSQSYVVSLAVVTIIACAAIMVIGTSVARAFGLVGALSIVRYRTVLKDTKDAAYIFLALVVGFACGVQAFAIAAGVLVFALGLMITIHHFQFGILYHHDFVLTFTFRRTADGAAPYQPVLDRLCARATLLHVEPGVEEGSLYLTFDVSLREGVESPALVEALAGTEGVVGPKLIFAGSDMTI